MSTAEGPVWVKSSLSFANGNCVEVKFDGDGSVLVRNSRDPGGPSLRYTAAEWRDFLGGVRNGEFDLPGAAAVAAGQEREAAERARNMAAEDGDYDRCEPTL